MGHRSAARGIERDVVDLRAAWVKTAGKTGRRRAVKGLRSRRGAQNELEIRADALEINMSQKELVKWLMPRAAEKMHAAIVKASSKQEPTEGTIQRRGQGRFFNVTGRFLESITWVLEKDHGAVVTDRLSPTVRRWMQFRIHGTRAKKILSALRKDLRVMVKEVIVNTKREGLSQRARGQRRDARGRFLPG